MLLKTHMKRAIKWLINPIYVYFYQLIWRLRARAAKRRSERDLQKLDDHLLDDVGLRRVGDEIVPVDKPGAFENEQATAKDDILQKRLLFYGRRRLAQRRGPY